MRHRRNIPFTPPTEAAFSFQNPSRVVTDARTPAAHLRRGPFLLEHPLANPTEFSADPVTQDVDGFPVTVTAYEVGIGSAAGNYSVFIPATASAGRVRAAVPKLAAGSYFAAMRAKAVAVPSAWSNEAAFAIEQAAPQAPANFSIA